ncbi:MAG TPA: SRPBCC domain-containing protein [bacterium]|nr:SRPBCC domain-containing protein [bacterium]
MEKRAAAKAADRELVIHREFDAPRELVFQAWTQAEHAAQWWGPQGFTVVLMEMDARPGGAWRKCMRAPDGHEYWRSGVVREVVPPERLVFTYFSDDRDTNPEHETLVTVTFSESGGKTLMTFRQTEFESAASRDAHRGGWQSTMERFAAYLVQVRAGRP